MDRRRTQPAKVRYLRRTAEGNCWLEVTLHEGRRNQIRRMFRMLGHPVQRLKRVRIGPIELGPLAPGKRRDLLAEDVERLRRAAHGQRTDP